VQNTTINLLGPQTLGQEDVVLEPIVVQSAWFAVVGTPTLVQTVTLGTVTPRVRGNPGTLLQATGFGSATPGQYLVNTTHPSRSYIYANSGGTATVAQPVALVTPAANATNFPTSPPARVDTWAAGDTVQVYNVPLLNLKMWQPSGGDTNASSIGGVAWLQGVHIPDVSGTPGNSYLALTGTITSCVPWIVDCVIDPYVELLGQSGGGVDGGFATNCYFTGGLQAENASVWSGIVLSYGIGLGTFGAVDGDTIATTIGCYGADSCFVGAAYVSTGVLGYGGAKLKLDDTAYGINALWGPGYCELIDASSLQLVGSTWVASLFLSPLTIEGASTGTSYAAGVWTDGIALTPANLDAHGTLQNPRTGCRFFENA
jgi:hypothetical protein